MNQNFDSIPVNVLLIEDSPSIAMSVKVSFDSAREYEFEFSHSMSLAEATEHIEKQDTSVVILDLGLPDSEGLELPWLGLRGCLRSTVIGIPRFVPVLGEGRIVVRQG